MREKIRRHVAWLEMLAEQSWTDEELQTLWQQAVEKRKYFQHERLVHLLVTIAVGFFLMLSLILLFAGATLPLAVLIIATAGLELAYIIHYYHLENGVQKIWEGEMRWLDRAKTYTGKGSGPLEKQA